MRKYPNKKKDIFLFNIENIQFTAMVLENIKKFIDSKGISIAAFEKSIGMSNNSFRKSLNSGGNLGSDKLENILRIYSEINPTWLMTGDGNMLKTQNDQNKNCNLNCNPNCNPSPNLEENPPFPTIAAEPNMPHGNAPNLSIYKGGEIEEKQPRRDESSDGLIKHLVEQLNEKSEEIGALKQEVNFLKDRLAQCAENATGAKGARA